MSRRRTIAAGVVIALTTVLVGTALALSSISFHHGNNRQLRLWRLRSRVSCSWYRPDSGIYDGARRVDSVALPQGNQLCRSGARNADRATCGRSQPVRRRGIRCGCRVRRAPGRGAHCDQYRQRRCPDLVGDGISPERRRGAIHAVVQDRGCLSGRGAKLQLRRVEATALRRSGSTEPDREISLSR